MKAFVRNIVCCSCVLLMSIVSINASADNVPLIGDANGDGFVNVSDIVCVVNHILGKTNDVFSFDRADVNGDSEVNVSDIVCIINIVMENATVVSTDTIKVVYQGETANIEGNFNKKRLNASVNAANVKVASSGKHPFVCLVEGESQDGSLMVDADTTCTLILNGLQLTSRQSAAVSLPKKQKVNIELSKGSQNILSDASSRVEEDGTNACLYCKSSLTFTGKGSLTVSGKYGHGIASSKNITVDGSRLIIADAIKNGIHCDKFTLKKGQIDIHLQNDASKGIKAKEELVVKGGTIEGEAMGGTTNEDGDLSYSSLLKSDGTMSISGGTLTLKQYGDGGRCISVDKDFVMTAGTMNLECYGDGGQYMNTDSELDYYTPKCITVDDSLTIESGTITCLSTGLGGKGIVAGKCLLIGIRDDNENLEPPVVSVETQGECIVNNEDEDQRFGCPKGIKSDSILIIYDGDIIVTTKGMGGEGIESNDSMYVCGGKLECITFDDGINVARSIEIAGGQVYCNSENNDGIDSNGSIRISGGVVASVNQTKPNESFDSEGGQFYLTGGTVFGIGSGPVDVKEAAYPCYTTTYDSEDFIRSRGLILTEGKYICMQKDSVVAIALRNENKAFRSFVTVMSPSFAEGDIYVISEGDCPLTPEQSYFGDRLVIGGVTASSNPIIDVQVQTIK